MFNNQNDVLNELKSQKESHLKMALELGRVGSALSNIEKMISKTINSYTAENFVLQTYPNTFYSNGYLYNSIFVGDSAVADNAKLVIDGIVPSYTIPLQAGENAVNIPDGATYTVTTTSNKPVTALLTRYNTPGNSDTNVSLIGSIPAGTNVMGKVILQDSVGNLLYSLNALGIDNSSGAGSLSVGNMNFNGVTYDRAYNNTQGTLLASAARTTASQGANTTNYNAKGVIVTLNVTAASGTGGLTVQLYGLDPVSGSSYVIFNATTAVTATGRYAYAIYPGASGTSGVGNPYIVQSASIPLPRIFYAFVVAGDATSYTYSIGYQLIL